jgi:hypothetical protein
MKTADMLAPFDLGGRVVLVTGARVHWAGLCLTVGAI